MHCLPNNSTGLVRASLFSTLSIATLAFAAATSIDAARTPATAQTGSENPSFQRHFWRGQSTHGNFNIDSRRTAPATGAATAEALVEDGTPAAAIARKASSCVSRFNTYDPTTGTYLGRDGRSRVCR